MRHLAGLLLLTLASLSQAGPSWVPLGNSASGGGISNYPGDSIYPVLALDSSGNPAVAWQQQGNGNYEICFRRWDGNAWAELAGSGSGGGVSNTQMLSYAPSLALYASGNPAIAWYEVGNNYEIFFRQWNGSSWVGLGGSDSGGGVSQTNDDSFGAHLTIDPSGNPAIAWYEMIGGWAEVYFKRWNGSAWVGVGGSDSGGGVSNTATPSYSPWVAWDAAGNPVIAWSERLSSANEEIWLRRWNGSAWVGIGGSDSGGGISNAAGDSWQPSLALDANGNPHVAWVDGTTGSWEIRYRYWNGSSWQTLGGTPVVGSSLGTPAVFPLRPSLKLDSSGTPHIAWTRPQAPDIYYAYWNGSAWTGVDGSASGTGVSSAGGNVGSPSLALNPSTFEPNVVWNQYVNGNYEVYFKRQAPAAPPPPPAPPPPAPPPSPPPSGAAASDGGGGGGGGCSAGGSAYITWPFVAMCGLILMGARGRIRRVRP